MNIINWYKSYKIKSLENKLKAYKEQSGSKAFVSDVIMTILDIITWCILAYFIYIWATTQPVLIGNVKCGIDVTVDICNKCFGSIGILK